MKNVMKISMVIIGTIIGAGFASGKEIYLFFAQFGSNGIWGILVMSIVLGGIVWFVFSYMQKQEIESYHHFLELLNPKYPKLNHIISRVVNIFLLISFYIMVAGLGAYLWQAYQIPIPITASIFILLCYVIFQKSVQGVLKVNELLVPLLIFFIFYLGTKSMHTMLHIQEAVTPKKGWLWYSLLYASYNSILLVPVLISLKENQLSQKQMKQIAIISSTAVLLLALCIFALLQKGFYYAQTLELPLLQIVNEFGSVFSYIYAFVILVSIFTSVVGTGYSFLKNVSKTRKSYQLWLVLISLSAVIIAPIGFAQLVEILYPLFGVLGMVQIICMVKVAFSKNMPLVIEKNAKN